jgi:hypothetical protein
MVVRKIIRNFSRDENSQIHNLSKYIIQNSTQISNSTTIQKPQEMNRMMRKGFSPICETTQK